MGCSCGRQWIPNGPALSEHGYKRQFVDTGCCGLTRGGGAGVPRFSCSELRVARNTQESAMHEATDQHLLQLWANRSDDAAFREFAGRYAGFVFGSARRRVADAALAEEITQDVFAAAARQAARLATHASVAAWLHRATMLTALDRLRRRAGHERKIERFKAMHTSASDRDPWARFCPGWMKRWTDSGAGSGIS